MTDHTPVDQPVDQPVEPVDPVGVVEAFCASVGRKDLARCRSLLDEDVVYHNIPLDPIEGIEATAGALEGMFAMFGVVEFRLLAIAAVGDVVLTERVDAFDVGGTEVALPVMGAFEVRRGRITAWRDYFDVGQASRLMGPGPGPARGPEDGGERG